MAAALIEAVNRALGPMLPASALRSVIDTLEISPNAEVGSLDVVTTRRVLDQLSVGLKLYTGRIARPQLDTLRLAMTGAGHPPPTRLMLDVNGESDVLLSVKACQRLCKGFFSATDCVRLATVVSELSRNIYMYAGRGRVLLELAEDRRGVQLTMVASDEGPGFVVDDVMAKTYVSKTGLGRGLKGCRDILDELKVESRPGHTVIVGHKRVRQ
jgi:serine/threonine-protein kinase RsbT